MGVWAALPVIASIGSQYLGQQSAAEGTKAGAKEQARIETMKREYSQKIFDEDIERQKPFYDAGVKAGLSYPEAVTNKLDPTKSGAYQMQRELIEPDLAGAPEYVREGALAKLGAVEGERQKSRLMDLQQIGLGAAGAAGSSGVNLGNILAQSYGLTGASGAQAKMQAGEQMQSAWNVAASQLSGLPAYFAAGKSPTTPAPTQPAPAPAATPGPVWV